MVHHRGMRFLHTMLRVRDLDAARAFYEHALGFAYDGELTASTDDAARRDLLRRQAAICETRTGDAASAMEAGPQSAIRPRTPGPCAGALISRDIGSHMN